MFSLFILSSCEKDLVMDLYVKNNCDKPIVVEGMNSSYKGYQTYIYDTIFSNTTKIIYQHKTIQAAFVGKETIPVIIEQLHIKKEGKETTMNTLDANNWDFERISHSEAKAVLSIKPEDFE